MFELEEIFQFYFKILKDNKQILNIICGFFMGIKIQPTIRHQRRANFFTFLAPL